MTRLVEKPRDNWEEKVKEDGLTFYHLPGLSWEESSSYSTDRRHDKYWNEEGSIKIS